MVNFAVVGCGHIGQRHTKVINETSGAQLVAVCDIKEAIAKQQGELYGIPFYTDYSKMLKNTDADLISIATPHGLHAEMSIMASNAGKHALVEKPMALDTVGAKTMLKAVEKNGTKLFVVKQNRFNKPIAFVKKALDNNRLGKIFMVQCNVFWNRIPEYYTQSGWRGKKELEGGALHTQVCHFIDLLLWWFGDLQKTKTIIDTLYHEIEIEDCGVTAVQFTSGALGSINWTTCVYNKNYEGSITIIGEKGTVKIGGTYLNKIEFWDVKGFPLPEIDDNDAQNQYGRYSGSSANHDQLIHSLVEQLMENREGVVEGEEGYRTVEAIENIYRAAKQ